jgi:hypothetical protein
MSFLTAMAGLLGLFNPQPHRTSRCLKSG